MSMEPFPFEHSLTRPERMEKLSELARMIADDCEQEAMSKMPFTESGVARQFGTLLAETTGLALAIDLLAQEIALLKADEG